MYCSVRMNQSMEEQKEERSFNYFASISISFTRLAAAERLTTKNIQLSYWFIFFCVWSTTTSVLPLLPSPIPFDTAAVTCWQFFRQFVCGCSMQILSNDFTFFLVVRCARNPPAIDVNGIRLESRKCSWVTAWDFLSESRAPLCSAQLENYCIFWCCSLMFISMESFKMRITFKPVLCFKCDTNYGHSHTETQWNEANTSHLLAPNEIMEKLEFLFAFCSRSFLCKYISFELKVKCE